MNSDGSDIVVSEPTNEPVFYTTVQAVRSLIGVAPSQPSHNLLTNMPNKPIYVPKRKTLTHVAEGKVHINATEAAVLKTDLETISAGHHKLFIKRNIQATSHKDVKTKDSQKLVLNCKSTIQLSNEYAKYHKQFWNTLCEFQSIRDYHTEYVNTTMHHNEVFKNNTVPIYSAPFREKQKARGSVSKTLDDMRA